MYNLEEFMSFHHMGLVVRKFDKAISLYRQLGYEISDKISDKNQNVELVMCKHLTQPDIELIRPFDSNISIKKILEKNNEIIYHTCYTTNSLNIVLSLLKKTSRVITLSTPKEALLFNNAKVSFYYVEGVGIFEFLEKK